ncbi:hypothetical protein AFE02nite_28160 [Actinotalea fermentans]|uniref:Uncharacterized protein n=1 Tax=Actinotalea fermentans TaxID=43671 RepID=A0A511Z0X2_9CELL|nr:hypothetical protein AFE02nite_28160 [Actinotalea fermentans]
MKWRTAMVGSWVSGLRAAGWAVQSMGMTQSPDRGSRCDCFVDGGVLVWEGPPPAAQGVTGGRGPRLRAGSAGR